MLAKEPETFVAAIKSTCRFSKSLGGRGAPDGRKVGGRTVFDDRYPYFLIQELPFR